MIRIEYNRVIAFHPYRTEQPWDNGGRRIVTLTGQNVQDLEHRLLQEARDDGIDRAAMDNHYGYTLLTDGTVERHYPSVMVRFSDHAAYVWVMPDDWIDKLYRSRILKAVGEELNGLIGPGGAVDIDFAHAILKSRLVAPTLAEEIIGEMRDELREVRSVVD